MCNLIFSIKSRKDPAIISSNIFCAPLPLFCASHTPAAKMLMSSVVFHISLNQCSFFFISLSFCSPMCNLRQSSSAQILFFFWPVQVFSGASLVNFLFFCSFQLQNFHFIVLNNFHLFIVFCLLRHCHHTSLYLDIVSYYIFNIYNICFAVFVC